MLFDSALRAAAGKVHTIVPFNAAADKLFPFNFTASNKDLTHRILADTHLFSLYIEQQLQLHGCRYGIGGYNEHRTLYARSHHFDTDDEPRRLHLGTDIWGAAGTPVYAPLDGLIHSFRFNNNFGDYGATLILQHSFSGSAFYTLYGHLDLLSIQHIQRGDLIRGGERIGLFGVPEENGYWPPHVHFQLVIDLEGMEGDYPGVCKFSLRHQYLENCPDPDILLKMNHLIDL